MAHKVDCPSGVAYTTTHGEDDAVSFSQWHVERIHKKDYPKGISRAEALKYVKKV